jgi:di/tricarboxylate transporter
LTPQIAETLIILAIAVFLFVTERLRVDLIALLVLGALALSGLVSPNEALSGFSNPAVVTVWAVFILSAGLSRTGIAHIIGRQVLRFAGEGETRLIFLIMLTSGIMSGFMNNIGVVALLLPVMMDIARQTKRPPSKLLIPLAFGSLLGGLITLIGTPSNILISTALSENGLSAFEMFDYTPVGLTVMLAGILFMALVGRRLLPERTISQVSPRGNQVDLKQMYELQERLFVLHLPQNTSLENKTLIESKLGSALGLNVLGIIRDGQMELAPDPHFRLRAGDQLLVEGRADTLSELHGRRHIVIEDEQLTVEDLIDSEVDIVEVKLAPRSSLIGKTLIQSDFRRRFGGIVLAVRRDGIPLRTHIDHLPLRADDTLLVQGTKEEIQHLQASADLILIGKGRKDLYHLSERLMVARVPQESSLVGKSLQSSRLAEIFGLTVLGIIRQGTPIMTPPAEEKLLANDILLVKGTPDDLLTLRSLRDLEWDQERLPRLTELESEQVGLLEAVLSPHTQLIGQTLRQLHFREKYGLNVLAIWREGKAYRSNLTDMALKFGDALLLHGPWEKLKILASDPNFLVLAEEIQEAPKLHKAPLAALVFAAVVIPVVFGWLPIHLAAVIGAALMVLTGCLSMEEAYQRIEWKAVFLIAGMLPLGIAMEHTGAAQYLAERMLALVGGYGPLALMASLFIVTNSASQIIPNPAVAVLIAPIALNASRNLGISPYPIMMAMAIAISASVISPISHPSNVLIYGPGGYRFSDFIKVGFPLTIVILAVTLLVVPLFWPMA